MIPPGAHNVRQSGQQRVVDGDRSHLPPLDQRAATTVRLVLADSHPIVLKGMEYLFSAEPDFRILAACHDGDQAVRAVQRHHPDVLVLELRMPKKNGFMVLRELNKQEIATRSVLVTGALSEDELLEALRLGLKGLVLKELPASLLVQCIRKVHVGGTWFEKNAAGRAIDKMLRHESGMSELTRVLTRRELEILKGVAAGFRNREIARRLSVTEGTVKSHLHNIFKKLRVSGRTELILYARDRSLI